MFLIFALVGIASLAAWACAVAYLDIGDSILCHTLLAVGLVCGIIGAVGTVACGVRSNFKRDENR